MPRSVPSSRHLSHDTKSFNSLHQNRPSISDHSCKVATLPSALLLGRQKLAMAGKTDTQFSYRSLTTIDIFTLPAELNSLVLLEKARAGRTVKTLVTNVASEYACRIRRSALNGFVRLLPIKPAIQPARSETRLNRRYCYPNHW